MELKTTSLLLDAYSLEATAKDIAGLNREAHGISPDTVISVPYLPEETDDARIEAAAKLRLLGFNPMPHIAARRTKSVEELTRFLSGLAEKAQVDRVLVIAGDCDSAEGPYEDALAVIRSGLLPAAGIRTVGISGYPEGHPKIEQARLSHAVSDKLVAAAEQGMACEIATQFSFDAEPILLWLAALRRTGVDVPVRIGIPGPASIKTLLRFAAICGVGASAKVAAKYGLSLTRLLNTAGPDRLVNDLALGLSPEAHGRVHAHFYPFGGMERTMRWIEDYSARTDRGDAA